MEDLIVYVCASVIALWLGFGPFLVALVTELFFRSQALERIANAGPRESVEWERKSLHKSCQRPKLTIFLFIATAVLNVMTREHWFAIGKRIASD